MGGQGGLVSEESLGSIEKSVGGKAVWRCVMNIQRGRRGFVPVRSAVVRDEEGNNMHNSRAATGGGGDTFPAS